MSESLNIIELGPGGLFKTILFLVICYYGGKFLFRWWLKRKVSAKVREQQNSVSEFEAQQKAHDKGRVTVNQSRPSSSTGSGIEDAEYVDYEEVD